MLTYPLGQKTLKEKRPRALILILDLPSTAHILIKSSFPTPRSWDWRKTGGIPKWQYSEGV